MIGWLGITVGETAFITYSACPSTSDMNAVTRSSTARCSGVASTEIRPGAVALPAGDLGQLAERVGDPLAHRLGVGVDGVATAP